MDERGNIKIQLTKLYELNILTDEQKDCINQFLNNEQMTEDEFIERFLLTDDQKKVILAHFSHTGQLSDDQLDDVTGGRSIFCRKKYIENICWGWRCSDYIDEHHHTDKIGTIYKIYYQRSCKRNYFDSEIYLKTEKMYT